jgi:hypothetical protein
MACKLVQLINLVGFINCQGAAEGSHWSNFRKVKMQKNLITAD